VSDLVEEKNLNVRIPSDLKNAFTRAARDGFGEEPGSIKKATIEALKLWLKSMGKPYQEEK
jgi:hypothetical protein